MRKLFFIIAAWAMMVPVLGQNQSLKDLSFGTDETFDVASWNIEWFPKNGNTADSVQVMIEALDFDLIGVQEVSDTSLFRSMVNELDGFDLYIEEDDYYAGLAYIYKKGAFEVLDTYEIYKSNPYWKAFPRAPLVMELLYEGEKIVVINNHFKCCGNGYLNMNDVDDEENRRWRASELLKEYIEEEFNEDRVIVLGDLNDILTDDEAHNVFQLYLDEPDTYRFIDMDIAEGPSSNWSYPSWPSHLDHIMITNELYEEFADEASGIEVIRVGDFMQGGFNAYDNAISDHRPVAAKFKIDSAPSIGQDEFAMDVFLYPNPTKDVLKIYANNTLLDGQIELWNLAGQKLKTIAVSGRSTVELSTTFLPAGCFFVKYIHVNATTSLQKLMKY